MYPRHRRPRIRLCLGLAIAAAFGRGASRAFAQAMLADDVIILSRGQQARKQTQYADAVRLAIDQLAMAFVDAIETREVLRYKQANVDRLARMVDVSRQLLSRSIQVRPELDRMANLRDTAEIELDAARPGLARRPVPDPRRPARQPRDPPPLHRGRADDQRRLQRRAR